jgi:hypothetical protein
MKTDCARQVIHTCLAGREKVNMFEIRPSVPLYSAIVVGLISLALYSWRWYSLRDNGTKRLIVSSITLLLSMVLLLFTELIEVNEPLYTVTMLLVAILILIASLLQTSEVNVSNNPQGNAWWSGFMQGLVISFFLLIAVALAVSRLTMR